MERFRIIDQTDEPYEIDGESYYWYQLKTTDEQSGLFFGKYLNIEE